MTMPAPNMRIVQLPPPQYPLITRVLSSPVYPEDGSAPIAWLLSRAHPRLPDQKVIRLILGGAGIEVYSVAANPNPDPEKESPCVRTTIPMRSVLIIEEAMPLDVFIEELSAAESDDGSDGFDDESDDELPEQPPANVAPVGPVAVPTPPNGQTSS